MQISPARALLALLAISATACAEDAPAPAPAEEAPPAVEAPADQAAVDAQAVSDFSRAVGMYMAQQAKQMGLDAEAATAGFAAALAGEEPPPREAMMALQAAYDAARNRPLEAISNKVMAEADIQSPGPEWKAGKGLPASVHDEFMAAFLELEGAQKTASGLAYQVLDPAPADAAKPSAADTVTVHYVGRHTTGEVFDSSIGRGEPTSFPLNGVIPGWTEGLQLMGEGSTYRFVIPGELAYGPLQEGSDRPTGILIFDVTLLRIGG